VTLIKTLAHRQDVHQIELLEELRGRLMNRADYGAAVIGQLLQQHNHLPARERIQATEKMSSINLDHHACN